MNGPKCWSAGASTLCQKFHGMLRERTAISSKPAKKAKPESRDMFPALPLSRDRERMEALQDSLVVYRMVFGQSRQEYLAAFLLSRLDKGSSKEELNKLRIDLSPPRESKLGRR